MLLVPLVAALFVAAVGSAQASGEAAAAPEVNNAEIAAFFSARCLAEGDGEAPLQFGSRPGLELGEAQSAGQSAGQQRHAAGLVKAVALRDIKEGELLCSVDLLNGGGLTIAQALAEPEFGPAVSAVRVDDAEKRRRSIEEAREEQGLSSSDADDSGDSEDDTGSVKPFVYDDQIMKLYLVWLREARRRQRADGSVVPGSAMSVEGGSWGAYIDILPSEFDTPIWWAGKEIRQLKGSALYRSTRDAVESLEADIEDLFPALNELNPTVFSAEVFNRASFRWAHSVYSSRHWFRTPAKVFGGVFPVLPLTDAFNLVEEPSVNVSVRTTNELDAKVFEGVLDLMATEDIERGEELAIGDQALGNRDLLEYFGFVVNKNRHDSIELGVGMSREDSLFGNKKRLLEALGLKDQQAYFLRDSEVPTDLVNALRIYHATVYDWDQADRILSGDPISAQSEMRTVQDIMDTAKTFLRKYPTSAKEDKIFLARIRKLKALDPETLAKQTPTKKKDPLAGANHATLRRMEAAVMLRRAEKKILVHALNIAKNAESKVQGSWAMREMDVPGTDGMRTTVTEQSSE